MTSYVFNSNNILFCLKYLYNVCVHPEVLRVPQIGKPCCIWLHQINIKLQRNYECLMFWFNSLNFNKNIFLSKGNFDTNEYNLKLFTRLVVAFAFWIIVIHFSRVKLIKVQNLTLGTFFTSDWICRFSELFVG